MKFLVDNQLPLQIARHLAAGGHPSVHVAEVGLDEASDAAVWDWARQEDRVVVSKDEDFFFLASRPDDTGRLVWVRLGNCRTEALLVAFERALPTILAAFDAGQRIVELV